jgi:hypothetical protein
MNEDDPCPHGCLHDWPSREPERLTSNDDGMLYCPRCWTLYVPTGGD